MNYGIVFGMLKRSLKVILILCFLFSLVRAQDRVPFDISGDGLSDVGLVSIESDGSLAWSGISATTGLQTRLGVFGERGNHLVPGAWTSSSSTDLGIVAKDGQRLIWQVRDANGNTFSKAFGRGKLAVVGGADVNGNGILDAIYISKQRRQLVWNIALDPFSSSPGEELTVEFGRLGDKAFFFSPDGGADYIAVVSQQSAVRFRRSRKRSRRMNTRVQALEVVTGEKFSFRVARSARQRSVVALQATDGTDHIVFYQGKRFLVYASRGERLLAGRFPKRPDTVIVGDFSFEPGEELALTTRKSSALTILAPQSGVLSSLQIGRGVPFDEYNINGFGLDVAGTTGRESAAGGSGLSKVCPGGATSFNVGALWKPESDLCHGQGTCAAAADQRHGRPVVLLNGGYKNGRSSLKVYDKQGNTVCVLSEKPNLNGINKGADHYFSGWPGGCVKSGSEMSAIARQNTGSSEVYVEWKGGQCLGPVNPTARYGGI